MKMIKKAAALILAAAISVTAIQTTAFADNTAYSTEYIELAYESAGKPAKTTLSVIATRSGYKFSWKKVSGIKAYEIYASKDNGSTFERIATVKSGKTSTTVKTLDISKSYIFKIRSYKLSSGKKVYSKFSSPVKIRAVTEASTVTMGNASEKNTTVSNSSKQLDILTVPVSKINKKLAYVTDYLGQDLYVIKEKDTNKKQVYKVTKSALKSYKATGKLKADKIKLDASLDGVVWDVSATKIDDLGLAVLRYRSGTGENVFATISFDAKNKMLNVLYTAKGMAVLTNDGYTLDCYRQKETSDKNEETQFSVVDVIKPDGRLFKRLRYEENENSESVFSADPLDNGVWYSYYYNGFCRNRWIDRHGAETIFLSGPKYGWEGNKKYLLYYPMTSRKNKDELPLADGGLLIAKDNKTYNLSTFDVLSLYSDDKLYSLDSISVINGTKAIAVYDAKYSNSKYSLMDFSSGKILTPVYDYMDYSKYSKSYVAYTTNSKGKNTGVWYYTDKGKKSAKFDDGSLFTKQGYALVSVGKQLFFVNKKFQKVSGNLKFTSSKGWDSVDGNNGVMTYYSGNTGFFVVYA